MAYASAEQELLDFLARIEQENEMRKNYPRLPKINIGLLRRRVAWYFSERDKAEILFSKKKSELGRTLTYEEQYEIIGPIGKMGQKLKDDLMFGSAGFEGGKPQFFSIITDYNKMVDEATGVIPPGYEAMLERMKPLSRGERYRLIEGVYERGEINWMQKDDLIRLFIDYDEELADNQESFQVEEMDMNEVKICPAFCPFRSMESDSLQPICTFVDEDKEKAVENEQYPQEEFSREETDDESDDDSRDESTDYNAYDDDQDNDQDDDNSDPDYSFSVNGQETDMDTGGDYDVDFGDYSASYDSDYDGGD